MVPVESSADLVVDFLRICLVAEGCSTDEPVYGGCRSVVPLTGKSFLATAIGYQACKNGIRTLYANTSKLLGMLKVAKAKGTIETELKKIERCQLLILDDAFLVPIDAKERPVYWGAFIFAVLCISL